MERDDIQTRRYVFGSTHFSGIQFSLEFIGLLPLHDVIREYLRVCIDYDNTPTNSKYCVQMMLREQQESPLGKKFLECQTLEDIW